MKYIKSITTFDEIIMSNSQLGSSSVVDSVASGNKKFSVVKKKKNKNNRI